MFYMVLIDENHDLYPKNDENGPKSRLYDVIMTSKSIFLKTIFFGKMFTQNFQHYRLFHFFSFEVKRVKIDKNSIFLWFCHIPLYISA